MSSNTALQKVRRTFNALKAGHTGTLDPLATGLLPICFGEAAKFSSFLLNGDKEYIATVKLGITTTTYDAEGEIILRNRVVSSKNEILGCLSSFVGHIIQYPPIYSALKVNGRALYDYARNKEDVEIKPRNVTIHELELIDFNGKDEFTLRVLSSKGTYIRSLAHDIGQKLGCGAHLSGLIRTKINHFTIDKTKDLDELASLTCGELMNLLLSIDVLVLHLPKVDLSDVQYTKIKHGHPCAAIDDISSIKSPVRLYYNDIFLGIATSAENQLIKPLRLRSTL